MLETTLLVAIRVLPLIVEGEKGDGQRSLAHIERLGK
jgi:hypothetical protein